MQRTGAARRPFSFPRSLHALKAHTSNIPHPSINQIANTRPLPHHCPASLLPGNADDSSDKVQGPASYFPSIEKTYGKPVKHWLQLLDTVKDKKHMEQVAFLKEQHKIGHGHANALVAYLRAQNEA